MFRKPRQMNPDHLAFVRQLPCCVCGNDIQTEAAHVRTGDQRAAKRPVGMGEKPDDCWTVPLCGECHRAQHHDGEKWFWGHHGVDPVFVALALHRASGDVEAGAQIAMNARQH